MECSVRAVKGENAFLITESWICESEAEILLRDSSSNYRGSFDLPLHENQESNSK
jgi:hypothetical protein